MGANQFLKMNPESRHGEAEDNSLRRKAWEQGKKAASR